MKIIIISQDQQSLGTLVTLGVGRGSSVSSVARRDGLGLVWLVLLVSEGLVATGSGSTCRGRAQQI